jgi:hypothetical protein
VPASKKYFKHSNIPDIVRSYPMPHRRKAAAAASAAAAAAAASAAAAGNAAAAAVSVKDVEREVRHLAVSITVFLLLLVKCYCSACLVSEAVQALCGSYLSC